MDNDREVNRSLLNKAKQAKEATFQDALLQPGRTKERRSSSRLEIYHLDQEFEKTKKNKNTSVKVITLAFIAFLSVGALAITSYIQYRNRHIEIDISDFEDINLKDLLNKAKKHENDLRLATRALDDLKSRLRAEVEEIRNRTAEAIDLIREKEPNQAVQNQRIRQAQLAAEREIDALNSQYQETIAAQETSIEEIRKQIDEYETRAVEQAKMQEEILNNQSKLHELEMGKTVSYYEEKVAVLTEQYTREIDTLKTHHANITATLKANHSNQVALLRKSHADEVATLERNHEDEIAALYAKYNPFFTSQKIKGILVRARQEPPQGPLLYDYQAELAEENVLSRDALEQLRSKLYDSDALLARLQEVPYENSVPQALDRLGRLSRSIVSDYESLWYSLSETVRLKNEDITVRDKLIRQYKFSFETFTRQTREVGYIIDPREPGEIITIINPYYNLEGGDVGYVFRADNEYIGSISFYAAGDGLRAEAMEIQADKRMQPFDKILLEMR